MKKRSIHFKYVSILKRSATQLSDARWGFETTSHHIYKKTTGLSIRTSKRFETGGRMQQLFDSSISFRYAAIHLKKARATIRDKKTGGFK
jgi:hypothetical protein